MQNQLFETNNCTRDIDLEPGEIVYHSGLFEPSEAAEYLTTLLQTLPWQQPSIRIHGKQIPIPRKQVWMGDAGTRYRYSGQWFDPEPWHPLIFTIKQRIEALTNASFNSVLCNLYRDGNDSVGWHADDEQELDPEAKIVSVSLGAHRRFDLKPKQAGDDRRNNLVLEHNSALVMAPSVQQYWVHQIAKTKKVKEPRINLTFRKRLT